MIFQTKIYYEYKNAVLNDNTGCLIIADMKVKPYNLHIFQASILVLWETLTSDIYILKNDYEKAILTSNFS